MRNGQNKRMRGRNNNGGRKSQNPLTRVYESNGPDVKIRGTASHIAEKYLQLARDAQGSGDPVSAENYFQHAEHYFRLIAAAQEQFRQSQPQQHQPFYRPDGTESRDESFDDEGDDVSAHPMMGGSEPGYGPREHQHQPYPPRDNQPYQPRDGQHYQQRDQQPQYGREQHSRPAQTSSGSGESRSEDTDRLPSFITGGGGQPRQPQQPSYQQNGHDGQPDRFPLHRRRRRHRGPRNDMQGGSSQSDESSSLPRPPQD